MDIAVIGVPLSIPGVGKDTIFSKLGSSYTIINKNKTETRTESRYRFYNELEEAITNGKTRILLNKDFYPSDINKLRVVVERLRQKKPISVIGLWFGNNAPGQRFTINEMSGGKLVNPFDDNQLWFSLQHSKDPHMLGYLYKEWNPVNISQNLSEFGLFDKIVKLSTPISSSDVDEETINNVKNEFFTPLNQTGGHVDLISRLKNHPITNLITPSLNIIRDLIHQEFDVAQWGGRQKYVEILPRNLKREKNKRTVKQTIAHNNVKRVQRIHKAVNISSSAQLADIDKNQHLLNKSPYELSKDELTAINANPVLLNLYRNIYSAMFNEMNV